MPVTERTPLYVRLGETETRHLERAVAVSGKSKRQLVEEAVREHLTDDGLVVGRIELHDSPPEPPHTPPPEVLTPSEAAALLRLDERTLTGAARRGELPGREVGGHWRFSRAALLDWLASA
jgi:excisionase family DNA binding protein